MTVNTTKRPAHNRVSPIDPEAIRFADGVRRERLAQGLSVWKLSQLSGVSASQLYWLESRTRSVSLLTAIRIARALSSTIESLIQ